MAVKPTLTDETFIRAIFTPSKNPIPAGLRKRHVVRTPGRVARRVRAFNNLSPAKQAILDKTNQRESYLRGETTLVKARQQLRNEGIRQGWAKPPRPRIGLNDRIADHMAMIQYRATGRLPDAQKLRARVARMTPAQKAKAQEITWTTQRYLAKDYSQMRPPVMHGDDYDTEGDDYYPDDDINPFWYND